MLSSSSSTLALIAAFVGLATAADCDTSEYGRCGLTPSGVSCCPTNFYCQPWDHAHYQCMPVPVKCPSQQSNISLGGTNLTTIGSTRTSEECCDQCAAASGCVGYTFVNDNPGNPACYLKSAVTASLSFTGAVSGMLSSVNASLTATAAPVAPANTTSAAVMSSSSSVDVDVGNSTSSDSSDVAVENTTASASSSSSTFSASGSSSDVGISMSSDSSDVVAGEADSLDEGSWGPLDASMTDDTSVDQ